VEVVFMQRIFGAVQRRVLNRNDMVPSTHKACSLKAMKLELTDRLRVQCPDPGARAGRADAAGAVLDRLHLAPPALQGALVVLVSRDTAALGLSDAQRLSHFPASPLVTLSWYHGLEAGDIVQDAGSPCWRPFGAPVVVSGSQSRPVVTWAPTTGRGYMACFTPDVAQALFGLDPGAIQDRFAAAEKVLGPRWLAMCDALLAARNDGEALAVLEAHLAPRWAELEGRAPSQPSLRQLGRHWVQRLAWQADQWRRTHSPRHVERRVKAFSGRSLRDWQALVKTEGLFFAARARHEAGRDFDWATLALDEGFADQAHMVRAAKRITGFAPGEFAQRFIEDESFWMYRLWV
jgi:hypothetical protein